MCVHYNAVWSIIIFTLSPCFPNVSLTLAITGTDTDGEAEMEATWGATGSSAAGARPTGAERTEEDATAVSANLFEGFFSQNLSSLYKQQRNNYSCILCC